MTIITAALAGLGAFVALLFAMMFALNAGRTYRRWRTRRAAHAAIDRLLDTLEELGIGEHDG